MTKKTNLSAERLRHLLHYDPETGVFVRIRMNGGSTKVGDIVGSINSSGRQVIRVDGEIYYAHRLAWLYVRSVWPKGDIDHINGNPLDNRISNLRDVDRRTNCENRNTPTAGSKVALLGVSMHKEKFKAQIRAYGKVHYLGLHPTAELAHAAYVDAKRRLHPGCTI